VPERPDLNHKARLSGRCRWLAVIVAGPILLSRPLPAYADELWIGVYAHDVTPISATKFESGTDVQLGWRGGRIGRFRAIGRPAPYAFAAVNLNGGTDYAAAGLSWRFGRKYYVRPGIGIAIHDGPLYAVRKGKRVDLGSRILFQPELAGGVQLNPRFMAELSWVHMSHGTLLSRQNRGMDNVGIRLVWRLR
jgi:lipid A 3-O-deacylase